VGRTNPAGAGCPACRGVSGCGLIEADIFIEFGDRHGDADFRHIEDVVGSQRVNGPWILAGPTMQDLQARGGRFDDHVS